MTLFPHCSYHMSISNASIALAKGRAGCLDYTMGHKPSVSQNVSQVPVHHYQACPVWCITGLLGPLPLVPHCHANMGMKESAIFAVSKGHAWSIFQCISRNFPLSACILGISRPMPLAWQFRTSIRAWMFTSSNGWHTEHREKVKPIQSLMYFLLRSRRTEMRDDAGYVSLTCMFNPISRWIFRPSTKQTRFKATL